MARLRVLLWLVCLCALAVAARNFEQGGLSVDGPLYALMARTVARTGEWFTLVGTVPHFVPYSDHPHLGIWLIALVFKFLPAADWSARIPGMLFYLGFLSLLFRFVKKISGVQTAVGTVLVVWTLDRFSSYCANAYLDPGALFFGTAAVFLLYEALVEKKTGLCFLAGAALAACAMSKGLTVLGFFPALVWVSWLGLHLRHSRTSACWKRLGYFVATAGVILGIYLVVVQWRVPVMLERYWFNQWTNRFSRQWNWAALWNWRFWGSLNRDSHYLLFPAVLLGFWRRPQGAAWLPWILIGSFALLYAPADRVGVQYWVLLLPWVAWAFATPLFAKSQWKPAKPLMVSAGLALTLLFIAQFMPLRVHGPEDLSVTLLQRRIQEGRVERVVLDLRPGGSDFTLKDRYVWYTDVPVEMVYEGMPLEKPRSKSAYVLYLPSEEMKRNLLAQGWCWDDTVSGRMLFLDCPRG